MGKLTGCVARQEDGGGLPGTQPPAASHVLLFLTIGGGRGRVGLVLGVVIKFLRRRVNLHKHSFFLRSQDTEPPSLVADVAGSTLGREQRLLLVHVRHDARSSDLLLRESVLMRSRRLYL